MELIAECCHFVFEGCPRRLPPNRNPRDFFNRKSRYSLNVQIVGGITREIYDVDFRLFLYTFFLISELDFGDFVIFNDMGEWPPE